MRDTRAQKYVTDGRDRTADHRIKSPALCQTELRRLGSAAVPTLVTKAAKSIALRIYVCAALVARDLDAHAPTPPVASQATPLARLGVLSASLARATSHDPRGPRGRLQLSTGGEAAPLRAAPRGGGLARAPRARPLAGPPRSSAN